MPVKRSRLDEAVNLFITASPYDSNVLDRSFCPGDDLRFSKEANVFFLRYLLPAPHFAPFKESELSNRSTLKLLISEFLALFFPDIDRTPLFLSTFLELLVLRFPRESASFQTNCSIAFNDNNEFNWQARTITPLTSEALLAFPFPSSALDVPTPLFDSYLASAFPDDPEGFRRYILEILGYLLLPPSLTKSPAVFYLYGVTGAGKSVLLDLIESFFPPYARTALSLHQLTNSQFYLASLAGKFINIVDEDESEYVNGGKLKALTSMRPMMAERKYQQPFYFTPSAKFIFASNQLPTLKNLDDAIERRLHLIEFSHRVPADKIDLNLTNKLITTELSGILGKALVAAIDLLNNSLVFSIPSQAQQLKADFFTESSSVLSFIESCYEISTDESRFTSNLQLYEDYLLFCRKFNKLPLSSVKFGLALRYLPNLLSFKRGKGVRVKNLAKRTDCPILTF